VPVTKKLDRLLVENLACYFLVMALGIFLFFNRNGWVDIASFCKTILPKTKKFDVASQRKQYDRLSDALVISKTCLIFFGTV
jgi:hypothetical protein